MPTVYRLFCENCGTGEKNPPRAAGYVILDGMGETGQILPEFYWAVRLDDGTLACLPHPIEELTLREYGMRWRSAEREGRLHYVTFKLCKQCGTLHEEAQIGETGLGCLSGVVGLAVVVIAGRFWAGWDWGMAFSAGVPVSLGVGLARMGIFALR